MKQHYIKTCKECKQPFTQLSTDVQRTCNRCKEQSKTKSKTT